jgi:hypothetical protein
MSIASYFVNSSGSSRLTPREQNRLNEAAKIRVAKILGVERNMIDLTDDEPPRKMARLEHNNSRSGFRNGVSTVNAPSPNTSAANHQDTTRTQNISSPRISSHNQPSSFSMDQTHNRKRSVPGGIEPYAPTEDKQMRPPSTDGKQMQPPSSHRHQHQPQSFDRPSHSPRLPGQPPIPGTTTQSDMRGLVSYQAPIQHNSPLVNQQQAPPQHHNAQVNPQSLQPQGPNALAPQSTDLAHSADLLNNISLSVASLELFQLQQILSTAALRHPDVLENLRTSFRIQETNKGTAHQALFDLLRAQSQQELRIARLQDERSRRGSVYTASPYGPSPSNAPAAPSYTSPTGLVLPYEVINFHHAIDELCVARHPTTDTAKLDTLKSLCKIAIHTVLTADSLTVKPSLKTDQVFVNACWRVSNSIENYSQINLLQSEELSKLLARLNQVRDGCFVGFADFLSVLGQRFVPPWGLSA